MSAVLFERIGLSIANSSVTSQSTVTYRRFLGLFGCPPEICSILWDKLKDFHPSGGAPRHLLYALLFLKVYGRESVHKALTGVDSQMDMDLY
jgi:hypothetical protein